MLKVTDLHTDLIGKIAKLHPMAINLEREYECIYGFGSVEQIENLWFFQEHHDCKMVFLFIDEKPFVKGNETWFCLKEVSTNRRQPVNGDWHWLTLNQLVICEM